MPPRQKNARQAEERGEEVTNDDIRDVAAFFARLRQAPYFVRIPHSCARRDVRRFWVSRSAVQAYPYNAPQLL